MDGPTLIGIIVGLIVAAVVTYFAHKEMSKALGKETLGEYVLCSVFSGLLGLCAGATAGALWRAILGLAAVISPFALIGWVLWRRNNKGKGK